MARYSQGVAKIIFCMDLFQCCDNIALHLANCSRTSPYAYGHISITVFIGYITNSQLTIYPCGLVAQWIEHCTGIARPWVRIPFKNDFFSGRFFNCLS